MLPGLSSFPQGKSDKPTYYLIAKIRIFIYKKFIVIKPLKSERCNKVSIAIKENFLYSSTIVYFCCLKLLMILFTKFLKNE